MILKAFKLKSNQRYIKSVLATRQVNVSNKKMTSVGILLNLTEFSDFDAFKTYFHSLGVLPPQTKIIAYVEDVENTEMYWGTYFNKKDFGWRGNIKSIELQSFIDKEFDVLVCYFKNHCLELDLVTVASKANFKVGISNEKAELYDCIINVETKQFELFKTELKKYLTVLKKVE